MNFEHMGIFVAHPKEMAAWYVEHLGMSVRRHIENPEGIGIFLADTTDRTILELCWKPNVPAMKLPEMPESQLHLALVSDDPIADAERLKAAGATFVEQVGPTEGGDLLIMLRDPWGANIQLAKRGPGGAL